MRNVGQEGLEEGTENDWKYVCGVFSLTVCLWEMKRGND